MDETAVRLRGFAADFERLIHVYEEKVSNKETIIARLEYAFDDRALAETLYDFAVLGHLSHANQLRARFTAAAARSQSHDMTIPIHLRTHGNRRHWIAERLWARKLSLRDRLMLGRWEAKREFLPGRPIWHRYP